MSKYATFIEGIVVDTDDPWQMGRVRAICPPHETEDTPIEDIAWITYVSPFCGQTFNMPAGADGQVAEGKVSYGFWGIPKVGSKIIVGFLYGDFSKRFYIGTIFPDTGNRSLPAGRNTAGGPATDTYAALEPAASNLNAQFGGELTAPEALSRGVYERQVAQAKTDKDGTEGYQKSVIGSKLDPQTYCITTPGRHSIIMQDNPTNARVRIKTAEGSQIILDDANERIYISTSQGKSWVELDQDGHVHIFSAASISMSSAGDFNVTAKGSINMHAGGNLNLAAAGHGRLSACSDVSISADSTLHLQSSSQMNFLAGGNLIQQGSQIHLNGPAPDPAKCAESPKIVPNHEPWNRPATKGKRGKNWKP